MLKFIHLKLVTSVSINFNNINVNMNNLLSLIENSQI